MYLAVMETNGEPHFTRSLPEKTILLLMALVLLTSLSLRLYRLGSHTLECEELYTIPAATGHQYVYLSHEAEIAPTNVPIASREYKRLLQPEAGVGLKAVTEVLRRNVHLPAYFYFMHYWIEMFGTSERSLRMPSAIFGALTTLAIFFLGRELFGSFVGLVSALLVAWSPEQIYFSQQARMYSLLPLLVVSSACVIAWTRKHQDNRGLYFVYSSISIIGLYTHYEYFFCFAAQTAYIWLGSSLGQQRRFRWLLTQVVTAAAFLPWVLISLSQKRTSPEIIAWVSGSLTSGDVVTEVFTKLVRLTSVPELPFGWLSAVLAFCLIVCGVVWLRADRSNLFLISSWIAFPIVGVLLMDLLLGTRAISITRYWMVIAPALYLLMSVGLQMIKKSPLQIGLLAVMCGFLFAGALLAVRGELRIKPDQHNEMAQFIDSQIYDASNQIVLTEGLNSIPLALAYYGERDVNILRYKWIVGQLGQQSFRQITGGRPEIWLLVSGQNRAAQLLEENGFRLAGRPVTYGHVVVAKYTLRIDSAGSKKN
jgi:uncharacterized membrane protein